MMLSVWPVVMALTISSLSAFCSRRSSLRLSCQHSPGIGFWGLSLGTYMVWSTFSTVSLPWMPFMAWPAFSIANSVSRLIFADSMALIWDSNVVIWEIVCSRLCSWPFLRRKAAFAAIGTNC